MQQTETPFLEESRLPNPDEALVKSASEGNREAFALLFNKYHKGIYVIALKYLKDKNLAEDVLQDVFAKVWAGRMKLDSKLSFKFFLYTLTRNHILNLFRNDKVVKKRIIQYMEEQEENNNADLPLTTALEKVIETLPKKRRIIVKLKLYKSYTNQQVAARLRLSVNTVKVQYNLAVKQLRNILAGQKK